MSAAIAEKHIMRLITDYLKARRILHFRNQVGASVSSYGGKKRIIRFGTVGMADYIAFRRNDYNSQTDIFWIEAKAPKGKQRPEQAAFQKIVESEGHRYLIVRSMEDLEAVIREV